MKKHPSFKIDFLGCRITTIFDKDWIKISEKILGKKFNLDNKVLDSNGIAFVSSDGHFYIAAPKNVAEHVIYHECFHVLMCIIDEYGLGLSHEVQETAAYLLEHLITEVMKIKKGKK